jgi:hypothetical protein
MDDAAAAVRHTGGHVHRRAVGRLHHEMHWQVPQRLGACDGAMWPISVHASAQCSTRLPRLNSFAYNHRPLLWAQRVEGTCLFGACRRTGVAASLWAIGRFWRATLKFQPCSRTAAARWAAFASIRTHGAYGDDRAIARARAAADLIPAAAKAEYGRVWRLSISNHVLGLFRWWPRTKLTFDVEPGRITVRHDGAVPVDEATVKVTAIHRNSLYKAEWEDAS